MAARLSVLASKEAPAQRSRNGLSRERIVATALELADTAGAGALTMRRLATELGVGVMTLYGYFRNKREVLDAMLDAMTGQVDAPDPDGDWRVEMRKLARSMREVFRTYPGVIRLTGAGPIPSRGSIDAAERALRILERAGFDAQGAARAYGLLVTYTLGFSSIAVPRAIHAEAAEESRRVWQATIAALPPRDYASVRSAARDIAWWDADEQFEWGLGALLAGLEAQLGVRQRRRQGGGTSTTRRASSTRGRTESNGKQDRHKR